MQAHVIFCGKKVWLRGLTQNPETRTKSHRKLLSSSKKWTLIKEYFLFPESTEIVACAQLGSKIAPCLLSPWLSYPFAIIICWIHECQTTCLFFFFFNMALLLRNYTKESQPHFALAQTAITEHHKLDGLSIEIYFSQFQSLEAYDEDASMIRSWWGPSSGFQTTDFSLYPPMAEWRQASSLASCYRGTNPTYVGSSLMT